MPHIIVEYSNDLEQEISVPDLLRALHDTLAKRQDADIDPERIASRAYKAPDWIIGTQSPGSLVAITLKLLKGRSPELRLDLASDLQETARAFLSRHGLKACVTAEPVELAKGYCGSTYFKNEK